ncbi:MAG: L7Ae/L30e/S12e/Gadd45 family ribosomal protein [Acetivibrionales bacterium]|jgi:ribosomal protein L7Ae-like RNA K-turn-binding protein
MADRIYSFISLAKKAGLLVAGEEACERALKLGKVSLLIVSEDASANTVKKFQNACVYRSIDMMRFGEKELLGKFAGGNLRTVIAIKDQGFAERLKAMIADRGKEHGGV